LANLAQTKTTVFCRMSNKT